MCLLYSLLRKKLSEEHVREIVHDAVEIEREFFPQLLRSGLDRKAIGEYAILVDFVKSMVPLYLF